MRRTGYFRATRLLAVGAVLLITSFVDTTYHLTLVPLDVALYAIPTAIVAFLLHGFRSLRLDRSIARELRSTPGPAHDVAVVADRGTGEGVQP